MMRGRVRQIVQTGALAAALALGTSTAQASPIHLADGNASADINPTSSQGMYNFVVDGVDRLFSQWFFARYENDYDVPDYGNPDGPTFALNQLGSPTVSSDANSATMTYGNSSFGATVQYELQGGAPDSGFARMFEHITLRNFTNYHMNVRFFQYSDFDLCGFASHDTVSIGTGDGVGNASQGSYCDAIVSETTVHPQPGHILNGTGAFQAGTPGDVLSSISSGNLNDSGFFTGGDAAWAFSWNFVLLPAGGFYGEHPGDEFHIYKVKELAPVPEPMSMMLLGTGLIGLGGAARRRFSVQS